MKECGFAVGEDDEGGLRERETGATRPGTNGGEKTDAGGIDGKQRHKGLAHGQDPSLSRGRKRSGRPKLTFVPPGSRRPENAAQE